MRHASYPYFVPIIFFVSFFLFSGCTEQHQNENTDWKPDINTTYPIQVTSIIDGDTIKATTRDEYEITIRFLGIDTPELHRDNNNEYEYGSISNLSCLSSFGIKAKSYTSLLLESKKGYIQFDETAGLQDQYDRFLCYISNESFTEINVMLLKEGYARVYDLETFTKKDEYIKIQDQAIENNTGLWGCS